MKDYIAARARARAWSLFCSSLAWFCLAGTGEENKKGGRQRVRPLSKEQGVDGDEGAEREKKEREEREREKEMERDRPAVAAPPPAEAAAGGKTSQRKKSASQTMLSFSFSLPHFPLPGPLHGSCSRSIIPSNPNLLIMPHPACPAFPVRHSRLLAACLPACLPVCLVFSCLVLSCLVLSCLATWQPATKHKNAKRRRTRYRYTYTYITYLRNTTASPYLTYIYILHPTSYIHRLSRTADRTYRPTTIATPRSTDRPTERTNRPHLSHTHTHKLIFQ